MTARIAAYAIMKREQAMVPRWLAATADADYRLVVVDSCGDDNTAGLLHDAGVHVIDVDYGETIGGFRFDLARQYALDHLPDDIDLCVSLDADEVTDPGFFDALRAKWDEVGGCDKMSPWFNTGTYWRCDRVHSRHGWKWVSPCHEVTVWVGDRPPRHAEVEAVMRHLPDNDKPRSSYLPLLKLAVEEKPDDARMWVYYARQLWFDKAPAAQVLDAVETALSKYPWPAEAAFLCRIAAEAAHVRWLERGTEVGPSEAEAWMPLAQAYANTGQWQRALDATIAGMAAPRVTHYLTDHASRDFGLPDLAARACQNLGRIDEAVQFGYRAWDANPLDERLATNLHFYVQEQAIPVYVVIPQKAGERDAETAAAKAAFEAQGAMVLVDDSTDGVYVKWDNGQAWARHCAAQSGHARWNVIISNNDVQVADGTVLGLCAALRSSNDVGASSAPDEGGFAGWLFALRGEDNPGIDTDYEWWYGDSSLRRTLETAGRRIVQPPIAARHLSPNESTFSSPERLAMAVRDEARFAAKWSVDPSTLFLARHPELLSDPTTDPRAVPMPGSAIAAGHPDIPWVTPITDRIWMGGVRDGLVVPAEVKHLLTLCPPEHGQYTINHELDQRVEPFLDQIDTVLDYDHIIELAEWVNKSAEDSVTLIHCAGGMNRSGVVVATALVLGGMDPQAAIEKLRATRSGYVLFNPTFAAWVMALATVS